MPERIPQSVAKTCMFRAFLASDGKTPATGKTIAITITKTTAGSFSNPAAGATNATEIANGFYYFALGTGDTNTLGPLGWRGAEATINDAGDIYEVASAFNAGFTGIPPAIAGGMGGLGILDATNGTQLQGFGAAEVYVGIDHIGSTATGNPTAVGAYIGNATAAIGVSAGGKITEVATVDTTTNLTNAPTAGDLTSTMKASVTAAVPSAVTIQSGLATTSQLNTKIPTALTYDGNGLPLVDASTFAGHVPVQTNGKLWVLDSSGNATPTDASITADAAVGAAAAIAAAAQNLQPMQDLPRILSVSGTGVADGLYTIEGVANGIAFWEGPDAAEVTYDGNHWQIVIADVNAFTCSVQANGGGVPWQGTYAANTPYTSTATVLLLPAPATDPNGIDPAGTAAIAAQNAGSGFTVGNLTAVGLAVWNTLKAAVLTGATMAQYLFGITPAQITLNATTASNGQIVPGKTLYVQLGFTPLPWEWTGTYVFQGTPKVSLWTPGANPPDGTGNVELPNFPLTGTLSGGNTTATFDPAASLFTAVGTYRLTVGDDTGGEVVYDVAECLVEVVDAGPVP